MINVRIEPRTYKVLFQFTEIIYLLKCDDNVTNTAFIQQVRVFCHHKYRSDYIAWLHQETRKFPLPRSIGFQAMSYSYMVLNPCPVKRFRQDLGFRRQIYTLGPRAILVTMVTRKKELKYRILLRFWKYWRYCRCIHNNDGIFGITMFETICAFGYLTCES